MTAALHREMMLLGLHNSLTTPGEVSMLDSWEGPAPNADRPAHVISLMTSGACQGPRTNLMLGAVSPIKSRAILASVTAAYLTGVRQFDS
jgi:hypothetical protein